MRRNEMIRVRGTDIGIMTSELLEAAGLIEDLEACLNRKYPEAGSSKKKECLRIGIKPNLVTPSPAEFGATTHPEIVEALICFLNRSGYMNLMIYEGSWAGDSTKEAFEYCGYNRLAEKYGISLVDTKELPSRKTDCHGLELELCSCIEEIDFLINVPVLKGHCQTKMTCALKNMKGLIPDREKRRFHTMGLHKPIAHLNTGIRQDFILVDDICGDPDFEEGGNPGNDGCILAAKDPVMVDAYACRQLGWKTEDVPYVLLAEQLGVGSTEKPLITDIGEGVKTEPAKTRRLLDVSYNVEDADTCSACYANLTEALWKLSEEGLLSELQEKIGIGQGMRNRTGKLGIGNCTRMFEKSIHGCPPDPDTIYKELRAVILKQ